MGTFPFPCSFNSNKFRMHHILKNLQKRKKAEKKEKNLKMGSSCKMCKYPIFVTLLVMYVVAAVLAIFTGGFLIEASLFPDSIISSNEVVKENEEAKDTDRAIMENESVEDDVKHMQKVSIIIGCLSVIFSLVFIWNAMEIGIILCCGRRMENSCLAEKIVKDEMRVILNEKL